MLCESPRCAYTGSATSFGDICEVFPGDDRKGLRGTAVKFRLEGESNRTWNPE